MYKMKVLKKSKTSYVNGEYGMIKLIDSDGTVINLTIWDKDYIRLYDNLRVSIIFNQFNVIFCYFKCCNLLLQDNKVYIFIGFILRNIHPDFDADEKKYELTATNKSYVIESEIDDIGLPKFPITCINDVLNVKTVNKEYSMYFNIFLFFISIIEKNIFFQM